MKIISTTLVHFFVCHQNKIKSIKHSQNTFQRITLLMNTPLLHIQSFKHKEQIILIKLYIRYICVVIASKRKVESDDNVIICSTNTIEYHSRNQQFIFKKMEKERTKQSLDPFQSKLDNKVIIERFKWYPSTSNPSHFVVCWYKRSDVVCVFGEQTILSDYLWWLIVASFLSLWFCSYQSSTTIIMETLLSSKMMMVCFFSF